MPLFSALEPRLLTRWDVHTYVHKAREAGVRYFGGCCGFEPYHMREIAEAVGQFAHLCLLHDNCTIKLSLILNLYETICYLQLRDDRKKGYPGEGKNGSWSSSLESKWPTWDPRK